MTVLYLCPACEMEYGEPQRSENCMSEYCGQPYEEVKDKVEY
jgi:hypothetical protein